MFAFKRNIFFPFFSFFSYSLSYFLTLLILISSFFACSINGPVFSQATGDYISLKERYRFVLGSKLYQKSLAAEVVVEQSRGRRKKTYFTMRSLGINYKGSIRQRSYEGLAYHVKKNIMELRVKRCYLLGKKDWEARLVPLRRWDCDHLFFAFESPSNFQRREILKPIQNEHTIYSEWFLPTKLIPMPLPLSKTTLKRPAFFAGQIIPLEESPKTKLVVVWGHSGGSLLRDGQILTAQNQRGKNIGRLKVLSRPGDFIVCRWLGSHRPQAVVAYTLKAP